MTQPKTSLENVGAANYTHKINLRRQNDQEIRREGWVKFRPALGSPAAAQYIFSGTELLNRLAELTRPNGDRVIVGASGTLIRKFDTVTEAWVTIGSGYTPGTRWQAEDINGYLCLNNTVDLPCFYRIQDAAVTPFYEMREVGIARVGRIAEYNGFLFLGDVTEIQDNQLDKFMYGYSNLVPGSTVAKVASFAIVAGDAGKQFNVTTGAGALVATLPDPVTAPTFWAWVKKVDAGAGTVVTLPVIGNQKITLAAVNDLALIWSDGSSYQAKFFAGGVVPAPAPYGTPPADIVQEVPDEQAWSQFAEPANWAPVYDVYMAAASTSLTLPFTTGVFIAGQTLVAVENGGPGGGVLGGQSDSPDGVLVTAVAGNVITLAKTTDTGLTYPRVVQVFRWSDLAPLSGKKVFGDGLRIKGMKKLQGQLISYRDGSIDLTRYTADATTPFAFRQKYVGQNVPMFGDAIGDVNGDYHLYPGVGGRFYGFDGLTEPLINKACDDARDLFFVGLVNTDSCWAVDNPTTKEIWFCRPSLVLAFDYEFGTVSEINTQIDAACFCQRPGSTDKWFALGIQQQDGSSNVYTYGLTPEAAVPISTWLRDGGAVNIEMDFGLGNFGDQVNEKILQSYTPLLSSPSPDYAITVHLYSTYNAAAAPTEIMIPAQALPDPVGNNFFTTVYQAIYFQDKIIGTDTRDIDFRFSARLLEFDRVMASGVTRTS